MLCGSDLKGEIHTYHIYPLVICEDRYGGTYSGGNFTAWNCYPNEIPTAVFDSDTECCEFWLHEEDTVLCGVGNTIQEAVDNLYKKIPNRLINIGANRWVPEE